MARSSTPPASRSPAPPKLTAAQRAELELVDRQRSLGPVQRPFSAVVRELDDLGLVDLEWPGWRAETPWQTRPETAPPWVQLTAEGFEALEHARRRDRSRMAWVDPVG